jgi:dTDP-4-dehydrorhamnose 3,5-epimerase
VIAGVKTKPLRTHCDERGRLFEVLRADDDLFEKFGQAYITTAYPGVVKAWHMHKQQTDNMCVVCGNVKFVLYDPRQDSATRGEINEFFLGADRRLLLQIPAGIYHGFKNVGLEEAIILNIPTNTYNSADPDEHRIDPHGSKIPYAWTRRDG